MPPFAESETSYLGLLARGLDAEGVDVRPIPLHGWPLAEMARERDHAVLHLQWLHPYSRDRNSVRALGKSLSLRFHLAYARAIGIPVVWTAHNLNDHEGRRSALDRGNRETVIASADAVIAHSGEAARALKRRFGTLDSSRVRIIPHGHWIDVFPNRIDRAAARERLRLDAETFVILFLGRVREYKGVEELLEAFRCLSGAALALVVAGSVRSPSLERRLRERASEDPRVRLVPRHVADDEIQEFMNAADLVALPYRDVLTSGAAVLAMSFGKACVAPRLAHLADAFADEGVFHYAPGSRSGLVEALRRAVDRRSQLAERGAQNLERAREWDWRRIARMTRAVYLEAFGLDAPGPSARADSRKL